MKNQLVEDAWRKIRSWYEASVPNPPFVDFFDWGAPASKAEIAEVQNVIGVDFPDDIRTSYGILNGDNKNDLLPGGYFMDLAEVSMTWNIFKEPVDECLFDECDAKPKGPIKKLWWNPRWIPILHNGDGDYHCVDMDPAKGGVTGQFIKFQHEFGPSHILAPSFEAFLTKFANDLQSGKYEFDMLQGAVKLAS